MGRVALQMLARDRRRCAAIIVGIAFATLLMAQQGSVFCGVMLRTASQIYNVPGADLWVMDPQLQYADEIKPLSDDAVYRVRGVSGVAWAVPLYLGRSQIQLRNGIYKEVFLIGLDDATMVGAPPEMLVGETAALRQPDAVLLNEDGFRYLWPEEPLHAGTTFEINDHRAVVAGVCKAFHTLMPFPIVYTRFSQAMRYLPTSRRQVSFVLAHAQPGLPLEELGRHIREQTDLLALPRRQFIWKTMAHWLLRTPIAKNFGVTLIFAFLAGSAFVGQTFYTFTVENLKQFATLKALGVSDLAVVGMVLLQASFLGFTGYGLGTGLAAVYGKVVQSGHQYSDISFYMPWHVPAGTGLAVFLMMALSSFLSIRRVLVLEPALVFRS